MGEVQKKKQLRGSYEDIQAAFEVYNQNASGFNRSAKEALEELDSFKYLLDCWLSNDAEPVEKFLEGEMDSNLDNTTKCVLEIPQPEEGQKFRIPFSIDHASGNIVIESDEDEGPNVQAQVSAEFAIDSAYRYLKFRELLLEVKNRGL